MPSTCRFTIFWESEWTEIPSISIMARPTRVLRSEMQGQDCGSEAKRAASQISKLTQSKRMRVICFIGVYFASVVFGILCFAIWQTISRHSNFFHVFIGYLFFFITKYLISIVIVPLITELIDLDRVNVGIRWVVILFSVLVLIIAPYIFPVRNYDKNVSKLELGGMVFTKKDEVPVTNVGYPTST